MSRLESLTRPIPTQGGAAGLAGRMPSNWRTDSSAMGDCATAGDSGAIGVTEPTRDCTQRHIVRHLLPAQGLGVPWAPGINDRRVTHNMCCVHVPAAKRRPRRAGTSTVAGDVPSCQPRERSRLVVMPGQVALVAPDAAARRPYLAESPPLERNGMTAG